MGGESGKSGVGGERSARFEIYFFSPTQERTRFDVHDDSI